MNVTGRNILLGGLILLFCFSMWYCIQALRVSAPVEETVVQESKEGGAKEEAQIAPPVDYAGLAEKNLFHPERRFVDKASQAGDQASLAPPAVMPALVLKGVVQDTGGEFAAYVSIDGKKAQPLRVGDRIDDIKVVAITATDVTLKWFATDVKLTLAKVKSMGVKR